MQVKHETHRTPCALSDTISKFGLHLGRLHVKLATGDPATKHRSSSCGAQSVAKAGSARTEDESRSLIQPRRHKGKRHYPKCHCMDHGSFSRARWWGTHHCPRSPLQAKKALG